MESWNPWKIKIYLYLVSKANEKDSEWKGIHISRGQLFRSLRTIRDDVSYIIHYTNDPNRQKKPPVSTVKRVIDNLKMKQLIDVKMEQHGMLITVNNYEVLFNTPFIKMVQQFRGKVVQERATAAEMLRRHTNAPDWLLKEWGIIE